MTSLVGTKTFWTIISDISIKPSFASLTLRFVPKNLLSCRFDEIPFWFTNPGVTGWSFDALFGWAMTSGLIRVLRLTSKRAKSAFAFKAGKKCVLVNERDRERESYSIGVKECERECVIMGVWKWVRKGGMVGRRKNDQWVKGQRRETAVDKKVRLHETE